MEANIKWTRQGIRDLNYYGPRPSASRKAAEPTVEPAIVASEAQVPNVVSEVALVEENVLSPGNT